MPSARAPDAGAVRSHEHRAVVQPTVRILYVPTPKVMSSTLLWMLASVDGDPARRLPGGVLGPTPSTAIHDPAVHRLRSLAELRGDRRREALESPRWMRLALTRDPFARLFSAWQHVVLLGTPGALPFPAPAPVGAADGRLDVGASFRAFVATLDRHWDRAARNVHFVPQAELLAAGAIAYTDLVPMEETGALAARLQEHAPGMALSPPRNEGLGLDHRCCWDGASVEVVARRYAGDLDLRGDATSDIALVGNDTAPVVLDPVAARLLDAVHERNQRLDLLRRGLRLRWVLARRWDRLGRDVRRHRR